MKTTLSRLLLLALLFSLSFAFALAFRTTNLFSASQPFLSASSAEQVEKIVPLADASLFNSAPAQVRLDLAPYCTIPSHAVTLDVSRVRSYVLCFRKPHDYTTPFIQFLRPQFVPDCRFVRHQLVLVPATRNQPGSMDIAYLPLQVGKQALMIAQTGGQPGTTVFTIPVPAASSGLDAAQARTELAALLGKYFLWSPKPADLIASRLGANFECVPATASFPGNVFDTLDAEVTPNFVIIKMRNIRLQDYKAIQAVVTPSSWFRLLESNDRGDQHYTKGKEWRECCRSDSGKTE